MAILAIMMRLLNDIVILKLHLNTTGLMLMKWYMRLTDEDVWVSKIQKDW